MPRRLVVDIECNGFYQEVTKIHCIVAKDIESGKVFLVTEDLDLFCKNVLKPADEIIGHNFIDYDMRVIEKLTKVKLDVTKITDTMLLSYMTLPHLKRHKDCPPSKETKDGRRIIGPHGLENWGYHVGKGKVEYEDWSTFTPEMLRRCKKDVEITHLVYSKLKGE